jgi:hypothetical protein
MAEHVEELVLKTAQEIEAVVVTNPVQYVDACEWLKKVAEKRREVEEFFEPTISAAHTAHKAALTAKKKALEPLLCAEELLRFRITGYLEEERKRAEEEAQRRPSAGDGCEQPGALDAIVTRSGPVLRPEVEGVATRKLWCFRVTDPTKIPRQYLKIDEQKIGQVVRALKDQTNIPGIEVYAQDSLAVRTR